MALPGDLNVVTVTGKYVDAAGVPLAGSVTFSPSTTLTDSTGNVVIPGYGRTYPLVNGAFTSDPLVATDDGTISPSGWTYTVLVAVQNLPQYSYPVLIPHTPSTVDISALTPVASPGTPVLTSPNLLVPTAVRTSAYTAVPGDMVKTDTSSGSLTVTLPAAPAVNSTIGVKQVTVAGVGTNATTIACGGSDVLNKSGGPASMTLDRLDQTVILQYGSGGIWTVESADPAAGQIATSRQGVYYLDTFTGTDDQKMTSALAAVVAAGGGTIQLSPRSHTFANQWTSVFSGTRIKLRIQGTGAAPHGQSEGIPTGTTTCAMQYSGAGAARIDFHHSGSVEIDHILFTDGTGSTVPFMQFTNAQPYVHDCAFKGDNSLQSANQDAIYFGGVGSIVTSGTDTDPFQAYQGVVERCSFSYIRTACWARTYANSISMRDLLIDNSCGSPNVFSVSDAAMTQGSAVLTSATAAFTSGMVGQAVVVAGAGNVTYGSYLAGYISAYTSATQVTLSATAASTVSAQVCIAPQAAPIMLGSPDPNGGVQGCVVDGCCIEVPGYVIGILLQKSDNNNVIGSAFWDGVSTSLVGVACVNSSFYNSVYLSEEGVNTPFSSDAQSTGLGNDLVLVNGQRPVFQIPSITSPGNLALKVQGLVQANYGSTATNFAIGTLSNYAYMGPFSTADAWYSVGGSNTNINMKLRAQGTGSVQILSKLASQFAGTPAIAAGAAAGTSPTVSVVGNDQRGTITVTTGSGSMAAGALATVTFTATGGSWVSAPYVVITPVATGGAALQPRVSAQSTSAFTLSCDVAAANATPYTFNYICLA